MPDSTPSKSEHARVTRAASPTVHHRLGLALLAATIALRGLGAVGGPDSLSDAAFVGDLLFSLLMLAWALVDVSRQLGPRIDGGVPGPNLLEAFLLAMLRTSWRLFIPHPWRLWPVWLGLLLMALVMRAVVPPTFLV